jgi:hypothetical protein
VYSIYSASFRLDLFFSLGLLCSEFSEISSLSDLRDLWVLLFFFFSAFTDFSEGDSLSELLDESSELVGAEWLLIETSGVKGGSFSISGSGVGSLRKRRLAPDKLREIQIFTSISLASAPIACHFCKGR